MFLCDDGYLRNYPRLVLAKNTNCHRTGYQHHIDWFLKGICICTEQATSTQQACVLCFPIIAHIHMLYTYVFSTREYRITSRVMWVIELTFWYLQQPYSLVSPPIHCFHASFIETYISMPLLLKTSKFTPKTDENICVGDLCGSVAVWEMVASCL